MNSENILNNNGDYILFQIFLFLIHDFEGVRAALGALRGKGVPDCTRTWG